MTFAPTSEPVPDLSPDGLPPADDLLSDPPAPSFGAQAADDMASNDAAAPIGPLNPAQDPPAFAPPPPPDAADSGLPLSPADAARDNARNAHWAMSEWYDGWVYLGADGRLVVRNDGSRIGFRFADAARLAQQLAAAPDEETADGSGGRALAPLDSRFNKDWDPQRPKSTLADMTKWTRLLAYHLVQTTEPEEAVRRAVSMIFGNPVTMDERGEKLWVPTKYDVEAVKSLAGTLLRQAVGPEVVESDDQNLDAVEAAPAAEASPTTRTIRGVPFDDRGVRPNVVKAAATSSRSGDREPPIHERDEKIRNMLFRPPRQQPLDIRKTLSNSDVDAIWSETLARQFETKDQPNDGSGTYYFKDGGWVYGKYQMRRGSLQDIGMMDKAGKWTGKYDVRSWQDFLRNPAAQDAALIDWTKKVNLYIRSDHAARLGQTFKGIRATITITESGLAAAIHKQGSKGVKQYLDWVESHGWNSRDHEAELKQMKQEQEGAFRAIETRLRVFQSVPYKQQP